MSSFKKIIKFIIAALYYPYLIAVKRGVRRVVLNYHSMRKDEIEGFQKQMYYLYKHCEIVKPTGIKCPDFCRYTICVAITFDDGFMSVKDNFLPILSKYGFPAGISIPTDYLGQNPGWKISKYSPDKMELIINEKQIQEINNNGFEIHSHTVTHVSLTGINDESLMTELVDSKLSLKKF